MRNGLTRRDFVAGCALTASGLMFGGRRALAEAAPTSNAPVVTTRTGRLRGVYADGVLNYRGVPFAEAPVKGLRFRAPVAVKPWKGVRKATKFASAAMQQVGSDGGLVCSEDCLYLNVSVPAGAGSEVEGQPAKALLPVYVWIHGGANIAGWSGREAQAGVRFAQDGVVCVTLAYRLGVFGFMDMEPLLGAEYAGSQNTGIRDMILGLQWVKENIGAFGGDAERVTIGGESAGAKAMAALMSIPAAQELFQAVISESGGGITVLTQAQGKAVAQEFGKEAKSAAVGDLRKAAPLKLIEAQTAFVKAWDGDFPFRPAVDGELLVKRPIDTIAAGSAKEKRLLLGTNRDESALFLRGALLTKPITQQSLANVKVEQFEQVMAGYRALYPEMNESQLRIRAVTAEEYWVPSVRMADAHAQAGGETWMYRFDYPAASGPMQGEAFHSEEIGFAFGVQDHTNDPEKKRLTEEMHAAWVAFIKGSVPAASGLPVWPKYEVERRATMVLTGGESLVEERPMEKDLLLWDGVL